MTNRYEPELPEPELHKPETIDEMYDKMDREMAEQPPLVESPALPPVADPGIEAAIHQRLSRSDFEASSWGPRGNRFAQFHLAGDCDVVIYYPAPGDKDCAVEIITGTDQRDPMYLGGKDTRKSTVIRLSKSKARAFASAIMGVAAEL